MTAPVVLTLDLGTSTTKAALWRGSELLHLTRAELTTAHPGPGRAEQDPEQWWTSVVEAVAELRLRADELWSQVGTVACSAARETFGLFDAALAPIGPGILWSDDRAADTIEQLGSSDRFRAVTGVVRSSGCAAAKAAWVAAHEPERFAAARWLLAPRDLVVARLTGRVVTDPTLESRTGWTSLAGERFADPELARRLPTVVPSTTRLAARHDPATATWRAALALPPGAEVLPGAGDRACEVLGADARPDRPMVSWGTTANVSVPHPGPVAALPTVAQVSRDPFDAFLVEAGLSDAGAALAWLGALTGRSVAELETLAATSTPGAEGALAHAWLHGARAPWWDSSASGALRGLRTRTTVADLARAVVESVAFDVARSVELVAPDASDLVAVGGGAAGACWVELLAAVTGRPVRTRRHAEAGSVGARLLAAAARGEALGLDDVNPLVTSQRPDPVMVETYIRVRAAHDRSAISTLGR